MIYCSGGLWEHSYALSMIQAELVIDYTDVFQQIYDQLDTVHMKMQYLFYSKSITTIVVQLGRSNNLSKLSK